MKKYEILEHRADFKIRAFGKTKEELFLNGLLGMEDFLKPELKNQKSERRNIKIKSIDLSALLVDFLSEALYLIQINKEIYGSSKFVKFSENELECEFFGQKVEKFKEDIKAVTYHDLNISQRKDGIWETVILFDI